MKKYIHEEAEAKMNKSDFVEKGDRLLREVNDHVSKIMRLLEDNKEVTGLAKLGIVISVAAMDKPLISFFGGEKSGIDKAMLNVIAIAEDMKK